MDIRFTIEDNDFVLIPVEFNAILEQADYIFGGFVFRKNMLQRLVQYSNSNKDLYYVWDLKNVELCDDRMFDELTKDLLSNVIIVNVCENQRVYNQLLKAFEGESCIFEKEREIITFSLVSKQISNTLDTNKLYINGVSNIVNRNTIDFQGEWKYLVSSGVYSNMRIDLKEMFYSHEDTMYIIYLLYNRIREWDDSFDCFVATSKNGVALATILCEIFHKNLICFNIGQMFEEIYNRKPEIEEGKRYVHIFDVICLGSEAKVVNALISAQGGVLEKSFGVICLQNLEMIKEKNRYSFLNNVEPLLTYNEIDLDYRISLSGKE